MKCRSASVSVGVLLSVFLAASADAQQVKPAQKGGWQFDVHGGLLSGSSSVAGTGSLPEPGESFTTTSNLPSRFVPSYYFGDGAALLNTVASSNNMTLARIAPLDGVLTTGAARKSGPSYGFRIGHTVTSHALAEFSLDMGQSHVTLTDDTLAAIEASRASFKAVFDGLLVNQAAGAVTTSSATIQSGGGSQMSMIGSVNINIGTFGRITPFVTAGGGLMLSRGAPTGFTMTGQYIFVLNNPGSAANGTVMGDTNGFAVTYGVPSSLVKLFGGGAQMRLSNHSGIRADVRAYVAGVTIEIVTDNTTPNSSTNGTLTRGSNGPQVQISAGNQPSTLENGGYRFTSFSGSGKIVTTTFAYYLRF